MKSEWKDWLICFAHSSSGTSCFLVGWSPWRSESCETQALYWSKGCTWASRWRSGGWILDKSSCSQWLHHRWCLPSKYGFILPHVNIMQNICFCSKGLWTWCHAFHSHFHAACLHVLHAGYASSGPAFLSPCPKDGLVKKTPNSTNFVFLDRFGCGMRVCSCLSLLF